MDLHEIVSTYKRLAKKLDKTPTRREVEKHSKVTKRQIHKHGHNDLCKMAGLTPNLNSKQKTPLEVDFAPPKIFCFDMEILSMIVKTYSLRTDYIRPSRIVKDWSVLSWAGKFLDEKKVHYADTRGKKDVRDDVEVMERLHEQLSKADIILGHNSDRFDVKKANAKFVEYGLNPLSFSKQIDTLKIAKKYFNLSSNSLDFIAKKMGVTPKRKSRKFTNEEMWDECERGNILAFKENEKYNKQDVLTTIEVFDKLKAWDQSLNFQAFYGKKICVCGNEEFYRDGYVYNKQSCYQKYRCSNCGKISTGKENLIDKEIRRNFSRL